MRVRMLMTVLMSMLLMRMVMIVRRMLVIVIVMIMIMMRVRMLLQKLLARQFFFAVNQDIKLNGADTAALYAGYFKARINSQCFDRASEQLQRHSGIQQSAQKHIAADTRKTL